MRGWFQNGVFRFLHAKDRECPVIPGPQRNCFAKRGKM